MGKTRCKVKENKRKPVESPKFKCKDCDEVAKKKKQLCEPKKMKG
jgi:hypothetical protein